MDNIESKPSLMDEDDNATAHAALFADPERGWPPIERAIVKLQRSMSSDDVVGGEREEKACSLFDPTEKTMLYTGCFILCTQHSHDFSKELYVKHTEMFTKYYGADGVDSVRTAIRSQMSNDEYFLKEVLRCWKNHSMMNQWAQKVFMYIDRFYVRAQKLPTLLENGLRVFERLIYDTFRDNIISALISLIDRERTHMIAVDIEMVKELMQMFVDINPSAYTTDLEDPLVEATREYYHRVSAAWAQEHTSAGYLNMVVCAEAELTRTRFSATMEARNAEVFNEECLALRLEMIVGNGKEGECMNLLKNDDGSGLNRMWRMIRRLSQPDGIELMASTLMTYVQELGDALVTQWTEVLAANAATSNTNKRPSVKSDGTVDDVSYVRDMITLYNRFDSLVTIHLQSHHTFKNSLNNAFVSIVNRSVGNHTVANILSVRADRMLRIGSASANELSEGEVDALMNDVIVLLNFVRDKDLYAEVYRRQLSKRLLESKSIGDEPERAMIAKMKLKYGTNFTNKMEGMLNDMSVGTSHQKEFDAHCAANSMLQGISMCVNVLTVGHWPTTKYFANIRMPPAMEACIKAFGSFYKQKAESRRIAWQFFHGNVSLKGRFGDGTRTYEIHVTTMQAIVLMHFANATDTPKTMTDVQTLTNIPEEVVKRVLHSLACGKFRLLTRTAGNEDEETANKGIKRTDIFAFNNSFTSQMRKIRIPMASLDDIHSAPNNDDAKLQNDMDKSRSLAIDAAIVRVMKIRKQLGHQQLISEVLSQLSFFRPEMKVIKKCIEALIERDYLERDPAAPAMYKYLA